MMTHGRHCFEMAFDTCIVQEQLLPVPPRMSIKSVNTQQRCSNSLRDVDHTHKDSQFSVQFHADVHACTSSVTPICTHA